jgi:hypothetical protein
MSYGADNAPMYRRASAYGDRIFNRSKPAVYSMLWSGLMLTFDTAGDVSEPTALV